MTSRNESMHKLHVFVLATLFTIAVAGCGGGGARPPEPPVPQETLAAAQARAQAAVVAALAALEQAKQALAGVEEKQAADPVSYGSAKAEVARAQTAYDTAKAANDKTQAARTAADARMYADTAEAERKKVVEANANAMRYARLVTTAHDAGTVRTKNARLFASANGDDEDTSAAKRARVGTVAALATAADVAQPTPDTAWDLTAASDDDVTTETRGISLAAGPPASAGVKAEAVVTWDVNPEDGDPAVRQFHIRVVTDVGTTTRLETANAGGAVPTNEQRPLPRIGAWGGFHGVELSKLDGGLYAHAYTDVAQTRTIPAQNAASVRNARVDLARIPDTVIITPAAQDAGSFAGVYDHDGNPDTDPLSGTFSCGADRECTLDIDGDGRITSISGYTFTGSGSARPERKAPDEDYLVFGIWLNSPSLLPSVGAFASGNMPFDPGTSGTGLRAIEGTATYRGPATGIHATATAIKPFDATATLTADFGDEDGFGSVSGAIEHIVSAGEALPDRIVLVEAGLDRYTNTGTGFLGTARMGNAENPAAAIPVYPYNGHWGGRFYGPGASGTRYPGSAAGVFSVTGGEGDAKQSFVGAFAAHRQP